MPPNITSRRPEELPVTPDPVVSRLRISPKVCGRRRRYVNDLGENFEVKDDEYASDPNTGYHPNPSDA
jgi:hypothetical protein